MIIMKFGGASITDAESIRNVINIIEDRLHLQPVIVASAMGKTTRKLLAAAEKAATPDFDDSIKSLDNLIERHTDIFREFCNDKEVRPENEIINNYFIELHALLNRINHSGSLDKVLLDKVLSYGELISTTILSSCLQIKNIKSKWIDARSCVITDDNFTEANPLIGITNDKIRDHILPELNNGYVPITQGFIGSSKSGETTTLGFEGSDYSAVLFGAALEVSDIQFWKNVPGIMTGDPGIISKPLIVKSMTFDETEELSLCGSKILHPKTIEPARLQKIPIHIHDSNSPDAVGTTIRNKSNDEKLPIKSITYRDSLTILKVSRIISSNNNDFIPKIFNLCQQAKILPTAIYGSNKIIHLLVKNCENLKTIINDLRSFTHVHTEKDKAIISLVGENVSQNLELKHELQKEVLDYGLDASFIDMSLHSINIIVDEKDVSILIPKMHDYIFGSLK